MLMCVWAVTAAAQDKSRPPVVLTDEAREVHGQSFVFDGHNDLPWELRTKADSSFDKRDIRTAQPAMHTDIPRLKQGGVGAQFWSVYVPAETAKKGTALARHARADRAGQGDDRALSRRLRAGPHGGDVERIRKRGKIASLIGVEGGHSIENSLENLRRLHKLGARYMTLTHSDTLDWADSATDKPQHRG